MGIVSFKKELNKKNIECGGSCFMKLSVLAEPEIIKNPVDIVLILDTSGSMGGNSIANLKKGAKKFIDVISKGTSKDSSLIGAGSTIGIVSFNTKATIENQLENNVKLLNNSVDKLSVTGTTNHSDAFIKATEVINKGKNKRKVIVMFTDGVTTVGPNADSYAEAAKKQGIIIYCIGLIGGSGIALDSLNSWASDPDSAYVSVSPDNMDIETMFNDLAFNIVKPGGTNINIDDTISDCFKIVSIAVPNKGTVDFKTSTNFIWSIPSLGVTASEGAELNLTLLHLGKCGGNIKINEKFSYSDAEGNIVNPVSPVINVDCSGGGKEVIPETCPIGRDVIAKGCETDIRFDAGELSMESLGRIMQVDVTLKNICPNKRVALAAILTEVDANGKEEDRGIKIMTIPAHNEPQCSDVTVRCIKFVIPEDLDLTGNKDAICNDRNFKVKFIAHYVETGFSCCQ